MSNQYSIPVLLVFKEVLEGDLLKSKNKSNVATTGGGARDLRFRYTKKPEIKDALDQIFDLNGRNLRSVKKEVHWVHQKKESSTIVEYWQPTDARPGELRIAKISSILGWNIDIKDYKKELALGNNIFYLLLLDANNKVWARTFNSKNINGTDPRFKKKISEVIATTYRGTKQGFVRFK